MDSCVGGRDVEHVSRTDKRAAKYWHPEKGADEIIIADVFGMRPRAFFPPPDDHAFSE